MTDRSPDDHWFATADLARVFGVSRPVLQKDYIPLFPASAGQKKGRGKVWHARQCIEAWSRRREQEQLVAAGASSEDAALLSGDDSPMLERLREEQWKLKRLERMREERQVLDRGTTHEILARVASHIRAAGETLQRAYGPDAQSVLDEALDDAAKMIARELPAE